MSFVLTCQQISMQTTLTYSVVRAYFLVQFEERYFVH
jgi:hypothetical protein